MINFCTIRGFLMNNHVRLTKSFLLSRKWSKFYLGLVVAAIGFFYNPIVGNETTASKDRNCLRIVTYNIRRKGKEKLPARAWESRLPAVITLLKSMQPDIIGLQEAVEEQINDLANQLENYGWFGQGRGKSWVGYGTDEYNPIFYNKKRLTLHEKGTFHINDWSWKSWLKQPHVIALLPRICTWGLFEIKETGETFYVYNTHLDHKFAFARLNQLKAIIARMKQNNYAANNKNNIILLGDFNTELDDKVQSVLNEMGLRNTKNLAKSLKGPGITSPGWDNKDPRQIDHIVVKDNGKNQEVTVKQHVVLQNVTDQQPSDHHPVYVDVCFPQTSN